MEASYVEGTKPVTDFSDAGFTAEMLYRGYMDDTHNTDNAWLETEVWNFHYEYGEDFSSRCQHVSYFLRVTLGVIFEYKPSRKAIFLIAPYSDLMAASYWQL